MTGESGGPAAKGMEAILSGYPDPAYLLAADGALLHANANGRKLEREIVREAIPSVQALLEKARRHGAILTAEVTATMPQGEAYFSVTVVPRDEGRAFLVLARDVTMERNLRAVLIESRQRYKDLVEISSDFAWETGSDGTFVFVSPGGALGFAADEFIGRSPAEFVIDAGSYRPLPFHSNQSLDKVEIWMRRRDETLACVVISCRPLRAGDGEWIGARGVGRDVTIERERETALMNAHHRDQLLNYVIGAIRDEVDPGNMLNAAAGAVARALGVAGCRIYRRWGAEGFVTGAEYGETDGLGRLNNLFNDTENEGAFSDGTVGMWRYLAASTRYRQVVNGGVCVWRSADLNDWTDDETFLVTDVAAQLGIAIEQIINHERILRLSRTDALTGLLNRRAFYEDELPRRLRRLERSGKAAALFYIDLDNFKLVNDTYGHQRGDEALLALRDILLRMSRPGDMIARLAGDEFVIWMDAIPPEVAESRANDLVGEKVALAKFSEGTEKPLSMSIGVAIYDPSSDESQDELLARADAAMYSVKRRGKGGYAMAPPAGSPVRIRK